MRVLVKTAFVPSMPKVSAVAATAGTLYPRAYQANALVRAPLKLPHVKPAFSPWHRAAATRTRSAGSRLLTRKYPLKFLPNGLT
jgi:hypothetical protein